MTGSPALARSAGEAPPPAPERGSTTMADRVIVAVAGRAAAEVSGIGGAARRRLGIPVDARHPLVKATVAGDTVALDLRLSVTYPTPVRATTEQVRRHVTERVRTLTGKTVGVIDITVVSLPLPAAPQRVLR